MHALRRELLPPSGVEFATSLRLTPAAIVQSNDGRRVLRHLVVARSSFLRIFEVREEPAPLPSVEDVGVSGRKGTEAVEGEVEMDEGGEGFVNVGMVKLAAQNVVQSTVTRLYLLRSYRLHGIVTGLDRVQTLATAEDRLDRLLISFKDAKIALLEWSDALFDLTTVSIHTYERAPQMLSFNSTSYRTRLRVDPESRCAALLLPRDGLAILPFYQKQADLEVAEHDQNLSREVPYSPSFVLDLSEIDERIHNVIDFVFIPGFSNPTIALLFETKQTWTGRINEFKDTMSLFIVTLDLNLRQYPIIMQAYSLPYDCFTLLPCPMSFPGVLVAASSTILYVDQVGKIVAMPTSGWAARVTDMQLLVDAESDTRNIALEGSHMVFVDERTVFVFTADGIVYPVEIILEGKSVSRISISPPLVRSTIPTIVNNMADDHIFIGSTVGPSLLLKTVRTLVREDKASTASAIISSQTEADMDLDDDIYGEKIETLQAATNGAANGHVETRTVLRLSLRDSLREYGPISDMVFGVTRDGERVIPELVTCTGSSHLGGFTLFQRDLPTRMKRKVHAIGGSRGVWSLSVRPGSKSSDSGPGGAGFSTEDDSIIVSTDATPAPGLSRMACRSAKRDMIIFGRATVTTVGAASFFQKTAILQVTTNAIRVLETDGTERQVIKDMDGNMTRPRIRACSISDPFILILREDDTLGLFVGETERGKIRRKDMSAMGEKSSKYLAASFCTDQAGLFQFATNPNAAQIKGKAKAQTTTLEAALDPNRGTQWLILCRPQGIMEIWSLPKLSLVFSTSFQAPLLGILTDSFDSVAKSSPQADDSPRQPLSFDIDQAIIAPLGETDPVLYLLVYFKCAQLAIFRIHPVSPPPNFPPNRESILLIQFTKILSKSLESFEDLEQSYMPDTKRIQRRLISFVTSTKGGICLSGVFFTGDRPHWIIGTDRAGVKLVPCGYPVVHAFTTCSVWDSKADFLLYTQQGPCLIEWVPDVCLDTALPSRFIPRGRAYSNITFDGSTGLMVAASSLKAKFVIFDEEGIPTWVPDAPNVNDAELDCSSLELISPDDWIALDGYEFPSNEFVNALETVELETLSTPTGIKEYIVAATTVYRGEDLAVKGATYIFEIAEVVPERPGARKFQLKLLCRDDAKGPVSAVCGINGYLVSSMGQKIFVRAFDLDERLVGVAFLDVGVYVTSLRSLKNVLLIGDAVQGVWFVAFQEDPFKLVILGKSPNPICVTSVDFFFYQGQLVIVAGDEEGVIRIYQYDPLNVESQGGQRLIVGTEFHGQVEYRTSLITMGRTKDEMPYSRLLTASTDGSLHVLIPTEESVYKRLQLLQGQLTRNVQQMAGLNPKTFRIVRNEHTSRPLIKGILDDGLLDMFDELPVLKQVEMTRQIASERSVVLKDLSTHAGSW